MTEQTGKCMCGDVRFTARDVPSEYGVCHCEMCRRWTGSALLGVSVPEGNVTWTGEDHISRLQSSDWAERAWCKTCGTGLWFKVTIMAILIAGLEHLIWTRFRLPLSSDVQDESSEQERLAPFSAPRLLSRLPDRLRMAQIISMSMQDHYVEINTTLGSEMLLMRLSDAIDLLDGMSGAQTHRSHWVARDHAQHLTKVARRHELTLSDGRKLPVSNRYLDAVKNLLKEKERA